MGKDKIDRLQEKLQVIANYALGHDAVKNISKEIDISEAEILEHIRFARNISDKVIEVCADNSHSLSKYSDLENDLGFGINESDQENSLTDEMDELKYKNLLKEVTHTSNEFNKSYHRIIGDMGDLVDDPKFKTHIDKLRKLFST